MEQPRTESERITTASAARPAHNQKVAFVAGAMLLLLVTALLLMFRETKPPHVTATFVSYSPPENLARCVISNHSSLVVHLWTHQRGAHPTPRAIHSIPPGQSVTAEFHIPSPAQGHAPFPIQFRRQDTAAEESREGIDSVLRSIGIRWPGLNPDSSANLFSITSSIPANLVEP